MSRNKNRGIRAYLIYPFGNRKYNKPEIFALTLQIVYKLGYIPIVASCYLYSTEYEMKDRQIAYRTLAVCEVALICYEDDLTEQNFREIHAALIRGIPLVRTIALL